MIMNSCHYMLYMRVNYVPVSINTINKVIYECSAATVLVCPRVTTINAHSTSV